MPASGCSIWAAFASPPASSSTAKTWVSYGANRIADMDRRKIPWKKYFFVNIDYKPFSAADWKPMPSGLIGPARLIACDTDGNKINK